MTGRFESKVILVTGGSSGIGLAVARRVAAEGGAVVLAGRRVDVGERAAGEIVAGGGRARFVAADVTDETQVLGLVEETVGELGRLDGAFNNAGDAAPGGALASVDGRDWDTELARNLTSVFYCLKAEIPAILAGRAGGSIVNNASTGGVAGIPGMAAYTAAKHGVVGLTRSAALELAGRGVRVNALVTGNVDTPLYRRLLGAGPDLPAADLDAPNPTGRVAGAEEVAAFVAFLLSDEAAFVTGAALAVDGGFTAG